MDWFDIICLWFGRILIIGSASLFAFIWLFMYIYVKVARTKTGRAYLRLAKYIEKTYSKYFSTDIILAAQSIKPNDFPPVVDKVDCGNHICKDGVRRPCMSLLCSMCRGEYDNGNSMVSESKAKEMA